MRHLVVRALLVAVWAVTMAFIIVYTTEEWPWAPL